MTGSRTATVAGVTTLAERLGHPSDARLLVVSCDDLGSTHAANVGVYECLRQGLATSASLMVPCPWAREAAARYRGEDVGVHLTLNCQWDQYRWGPITHAPSLVDGDGGFPRTIEEVFDHADLDEVRRECRTQIERAILWGFDVSHLDSHMASMQQRPEFFDLYLELALEFSLPVRLSSADTERTIGFPFRRLAAEEGVLFPDHFVASRGPGGRRTIEQTIHDLEPGVTELQVHPAIDSPEQRAYDHGWPSRVDHHRLLCSDSGLRTILDRSGVEVIGYQSIRELQRS